MSQVVKKTFPLGWIPSDDEYNGRDDGLLRTNNCTFSDIGIARGFRGPKISSDISFTNPINLYSKVIRQNINQYIKLRYVHTKDGGIVRNFSSGTNSLNIFDYNVIPATGNWQWSGFLSALGHTFITLGSNKKKDNGTLIENLGIPKANIPTLFTNAPTTIIADRKVAGSYSTTWDSAALAGTSYIKTDVVGAVSGPEYVECIQAGNTVTYTQDLTNFGTGTGNDSEDDIFEIKVLTDEVEKVNRVVIVFFLETPSNTFAGPVQANDYFSVSFEQSTILENVTSGNWSTLKCLRSDFQRNGSDPSLSWATVKGIRIAVYYNYARTMYFTDGIFKKATDTLKGTYIYKQVNAEDTGYYLEQGIMSDDTPEITVEAQSIVVTPKPVPAPANVCLIYRFNTEIGLWYLVKRIDGVKGFTPAPFTDILSDNDAAINDSTNNFPLEIYRTLLPDGIVDMIYFQDRIIYLTDTGIYPSFKLDPGSYDSRFKYEVADGINEICLFLTKIDENRFMIGTNQDIYGITGTLNISISPTLIQDLQITPLGIKFPPVSRATFVESSALFYTARDGWRYVSGSTNETITNQLALLYNDYLRYGTGPINKDISNLPSQYCAFAKGLRWFTFEDATKVRTVFGFDPIVKSWTYIRNTNPALTPYVLYAEEDNTLIYLPSNGYLSELDADENVPVEIHILSKKMDFGIPGTRKDFNAFDLILDTNNTTMNLRVGELNQSIKTNGRESVAIPIFNPLETLDFEITGTVAKFKFYGISVDISPRPPKSTFTTINALDFGDPRKKKIRDIPFMVDTLGNNIFVEGFLDCASQGSQTFKNNCPTVKNFLINCSNFATTAELKVSGGPFEFYKVYPPSVVEVLPLEKLCDQIGPLEGYKLGDIKSIRLRLLPQGNKINWRAFDHDVLFEYGTQEIIPNEHDWYEIFLSQNTSHIRNFRFEFDSNLPFHRTAGVIKIRTTGKETEFSYIQWPN